MSCDHGPAEFKAEVRAMREELRMWRSDLLERIERLERILESSLLAPRPPGTSHQRKKEPESLHLAFTPEEMQAGGWVREGAQCHTGGFERTASAVVHPPACAGGAVLGALGHTGGSAGEDGHLAPLGAPGGAGEGMEDHTQNPLSSEKCNPPLKKSADVKSTHPLQDLWNRYAPSVLPRWRATNKTRRKRADALFNEFLETDLVAAIERIANSDFLMGRSVGTHKWRASPEWFLRPGNVTRILEGEFDSLNPGTQSRAVSGFGPSHPLHPDNIAKRRK